ncbi:MAG: type I-E CRISPR-associated protein Cse2/CasB [Burkholderiales bacterium]
MTQSDKRDNFIRFLYSLKDDRAALAALRRGLGEEPGAVAEMGKYIYRFFPASGTDNPREERAYFLVASLFALHPEATERGNMGAHMRAIRRDEEDTAVERRFSQLLSAHTNDLPDLLRQAVSLLKAKEQPVNWRELLSDVVYWGDKVQQRWARSYWGAAAPQNETENQPQGA